MDADELRKSMVQEVKQAAAKAEERAEATRLLDRLREQATVVRARFRAIGQGPERRKSDEIYRKLDGLMGKLKLAAATHSARGSRRAGKRSSRKPRRGREITRSDAYVRN